MNIGQILYSVFEQLIELSKVLTDFLFSTYVIDWNFLGFEIWHYEIQIWALLGGGMLVTLILFYIFKP